MFEHRLDDFLDVLASSEPAPGGGAVAALSGALACSMISMVCNLTIGKKKYANVQNEVEEILHKSEELRHNFKELVEQDAEAFNDVMGAMKMSKNTDEGKVLREEALQHALQKATFVPLRTMEHAGEAIKLAHRIAQIGNKNVISDAGVAGIMAESAMSAGWMNVVVNINSVEDQEFVDRIANRAEDIIDDAEGLTDETLEIVEDTIYGE